MRIRLSGVIDQVVVESAKVKIVLLVPGLGLELDKLHQCFH